MYDFLPSQNTNKDILKKVGNQLTSIVRTQNHQDISQKIFFGVPQVLNDMRVKNL